MSPCHPPTDRPGAATARQKECGGTALTLPPFAFLLYFRQDTVQAHLSNMDRLASEASAASPIRFVAPCMHISPRAANPPPPPCCPRRALSPERACSENNKELSMKAKLVQAISLGGVWEGCLQRVAQLRGKAAPCCPYGPFLTTEPRDRPRYGPPLANSGIQSSFKQIPSLFKQFLWVGGGGGSLQRVAQLRGAAAPCYPYGSFLTTEPRARSRCGPPVTHARERGGRASVWPLSAEFGSLWGGRGGIPVTFGPTAW